MLAYSTALRVSVAWLIYASGSGGPVTRHVRHSDVQIIEYPLQLEVKPTSLLTQIDALAWAAWARVEMPSGR